jgi:hypothetical protein
MGREFSALFRFFQVTRRGVGNMAKEPVYHLDECKSCAHRHVCKYIDKIDKLLKSGSLPLDLRGASCNEFIPADVIDEDWKEYQEDYVELDANSTPAPFMEQGGYNIEEIDPQEFMENMNEALGDILAEGGSIDAIYVNQTTMELMKTYYGTQSNLSLIILTTGARVPLRIDEEVDTGFFAVQLS